MSAEMNDENLEVSVARLDERQQALAATVSEIKDNHLVHIATDIKELQTSQNKMQNKIAYWGGGIAAILFILQLYSIYISASRPPASQLQTTITTSLPQSTSTTIK